jgi:DNA-binding CsgD family transcriptional regulator
MRGGAPSPSLGLWALLETLDGDGGLEACREVAASGAMIQPPNQAYLRYADAVRTGRDGRPSQAAHAMTEGDALLSRSSPWCLHLGRWLVAEEAIANRWGEPAQWLIQAGDYFDQLGEHRLASACQSLLRKTGTPVPRVRAHPTVPQALRARGVTDRELEVMTTIAQGLSNREIAQRLYLSPKTVEKHISNLMDKLDVRSRAQLAAIATSGTLPA